MSIYPNGKEVVCKTIDFYQNWFDSNNTQLLHFIYIYGIVLYIFLKKIKYINNLLVVFSLTTKFQLLIIITLFIIFNNLIWPVVIYLNKIKIFIVLKKINFNLIFNKIILPHTFTFLLTIINFLIFKKLSINNNIKKIIYLLIFNLLGMYWSLQENLWGGLWNWNLIELNLLILIIINILVLHKNKYYLYLINFILIYIYIYLYYNHIPVILNVHNFTENKLNKYTLIYLVIPLLNLLFFKNNLLIYILTFIWIIQFSQISKTELILIYLLLTIFIYYNLILIIKKKWTLININLIIFFILKLNIKYNYKYLWQSWIHIIILTLTFFLILYQTNYTLTNENNIFINKIYKIKNNVFYTNKFIYKKSIKIKIFKNIKLNLCNRNLQINI